MARYGLVLLAGLVVVIFLSAIRHKAPEPPAPEAPKPPAEIDLSQFTRTNSVFYLKGESTPFNGVIVETYPEGGRKSRTEIAEGLPHGLSEAWFQNGQPEVQEHFVNGISNGVRTRWREDGSRESEGRLVEGEFDGIFRKWYENGQLSQEVSLKAGKPDGVSRMWFPSGYLKSKAEMSMGEKVSYQSWEDGEHREDPMSVATN